MNIDEIITECDARRTKEEGVGLSDALIKIIEFAYHEGLRGARIMSEETGWDCTEPTEDTHRTVRISATMETKLYLDINVPINMSDDEVYYFMCEDGIDAEDMVPDPNPFSGGWTWDDVPSAKEFNPTATDYSIQIMERKS